jgi:hypothetical protein
LNIATRIDFEDTYDGLGDALDETDDVFNDDTFGGTTTGTTATESLTFHTVLLSFDGFD